MVEGPASATEVGPSYDHRRRNYGFGCAVLGAGSLRAGSLRGVSVRAGWLLVDSELDEPDELCAPRGLAGLGVAEPGSVCV